LDDQLKFVKSINSEIIRSKSYSELKNMATDVEKNFSYSCEKFNELDKVIHILNQDNRKNVQGLSNKLNKFKIDTLNEIERVKGMYTFDNSFGDYKYIAGVDEVGRGPLAGPIVAAAVVLDYNCEDINKIILGIKDSKKLTAKMREKISEVIKEKAISYSIAAIDNKDIDLKGIAWCNNQVFKDACSGLNIKPELVLSDGYPIKEFNIENKFVIKGDVKSAAIACASIIAKVYRDNLMKEYALSYPAYGFDKNAGYGTNEHILALKDKGVCDIHRMSFLKNLI